MSMTFYTYRADATNPIGSHGPMTEDDSIYCPWRRTLDPTPEQEREAGWFNGPNFSNSNALMILRSLGFTTEAGSVFDAGDLMGRVTIARACPPIADDGMADVRRGNVIDCGVRPGYFADAYEAIAEVCEVAIEWGAPVMVA